MFGFVADKIEKKIFIRKWRKKNKIIPLNLAILVKYDINFIRERLLVDSIELANKNFPFGTGYGTFGSNIAFEKWSNLYNDLGYTQNLYLSDSFWPIIIGQNGWIGLIIFLMILLMYLKELFKLQKTNNYLALAGFSLFVYELICSIAESAFFNPAICPIFLLLGIIVKLGGIEKNNLIKTYD